jgi:hypothetical protein
MAWSANASLGNPVVQRRALSLFVVFAVFAVFTALSPGMPAAGLDPSWSTALNQAVGQGLVFGRDIVFTYGPYASVITREYHPATFQLMLLGQGVVALCYAITLLLLLEGTPTWRVLALLFFSAGCMFFPDPLFMSYPLVLALLCYRLVLPEVAVGRINLPAWASPGVALLFVPFGVLVLSKGTILLICGAVSVLCAALFVQQRRFLLAALVLLVPLLSLLGFWILCGQPLAALPDFIKALGPIMSGYPQAMALSSYRRAPEIILYALAAIGLLRWAWRSGEALPLRFFLLLVYAAFLFVAFKGAFVRHDIHAAIAASAIILALLLSGFAGNSGPGTKVVLLCLLAWWSCDHHSVHTRVRDLRHNIADRFGGLVQGAYRLASGTGALKQAYAADIASIGLAHPLQRRAGTTDIYPVDLAWLFASGNSWAPRPVFQSYSAYTPVLLERNRQHLLGPSAPDHVLVRLAAIDGRLPALEEGYSWPVLLTRYRVDGIDNGFVAFTRQAQAAQMPALQAAGSAEYALGSEVPVPAGDGPLYASIMLEPTLAGRAASVLLRYPGVQIGLTLANGKEHDYVFVPGMASLPFPLSPLVEDTAGFCRFALADQAGLAGNRVLHFRLHAASRLGALAWQPRFRVTWSRLPPGPVVMPAAAINCAGLAGPA